MGKWLQWIEQQLGGGPGGKKRINTYRWLILLGLLGAAFMIFNSFLQVKMVEPPPDTGNAPLETFAGNSKQPATDFSEYEEAYESALRDILQKVVGVGEVEVLVTIESTEETVIHSNMQEAQQVTDEKDHNGSTRHITEITRNGEVALYEASGSTTPIVLKKINPKIRGVVVVAKGAENLTVKQMIAEAVSRGLDVPAHRISVLPRKH
jgi:stage III sporulation protein AG